MYKHHSCDLQLTELNCESWENWQIVYTNEHKFSSLIIVKFQNLKYTSIMQ